MKKMFYPVSALILATTLLTGCIALDIGGGTKESRKATVGQQLIDLKTAKDSGAITDSEYQVQKAKILEAKQ